MIAPLFSFSAGATAEGSDKPAPLQLHLSQGQTINNPSGRQLIAQLFEAKKKQHQVEASRDAGDDATTDSSDGSSNRPSVTITASNQEKSDQFAQCLQLLNVLKTKRYTNMPQFSANSTFNSRAFRAQLEKANAKSSGLAAVPSWKLGFDAQLFVRACRLLPTFVLDRLPRDWARFSSSTDKRTFEQYIDGLQTFKEAAWAELQAIFESGDFNIVQPISPEFLQLTRDFYSGKEVAEDYSTVKPPSDADNSSFDVFSINDRSDILPDKPLSNENLAVFLIDALLSREIKKAIANNGKYKSMRVLHGPHHASVTSRLNQVEKARANGEQAVWKEGTTSYYFPLSETPDGTISCRLVDKKQTKILLADNSKPAADDGDRGTDSILSKININGIKGGKQDEDDGKTPVDEAPAKSTKSKKKKKKKAKKPAAETKTDTNEGQVAEGDAPENPKAHEAISNIARKETIILPTNLEGEKRQSANVESEREIKKAEFRLATTQPESIDDNHTLDTLKGEELSAASSETNPSAPLVKKNCLEGCDLVERVPESPAKSPVIPPKSASHISKDVSSHTLAHSPRADPMTTTDKERILPTEITNTLKAGPAKPKSDFSSRVNVAAAFPANIPHTASINNEVFPRLSTTSKKSIGQENSCGDQANSKSKSSSQSNYRKTAKAKGQAQAQAQAQAPQAANFLGSTSQDHIGLFGGNKVTNGHNSQNMHKHGSTVHVIRAAKQVVVPKSSLPSTETVKQTAAVSPSSVPVAERAKQPVIVKNSSVPVAEHAKQSVTKEVSHAPVMEAAEETIAVPRLSKPSIPEASTEVQDQAAAMVVKTPKNSEESLSHNRFPSSQDVKSKLKETGPEVEVLKPPPQMTSVRNPRVFAIQFGDAPIGFGLSLPPGISREPRIIHPHSPPANDEPMTGAVSYASPAGQSSHGPGQNSANESQGYYNASPSFATTMPTTNSDESAAFPYNNYGGHEVRVYLGLQENLIQSRASRSYSVPTPANNPLIGIPKPTFGSHFGQDTKKEEAEYDGDAHAHPAASEDQPSERNDQRPAGSSAFSCSCCKVVRYPTADAPVYFCPFCGPLNNVRYCSRPCILADVFEHAGHCVSYSASSSAVDANLPRHYIYDKDAVSNLQRWDGPANQALVRQNVFSMYCFSGPFPEVLKAWSMKSPDRAGLCLAGVWEANTKITGDYHIFRSEVTAVGGFSPAEVVTTFRLPSVDPFKRDFNRLILACFMFGKMDHLLVAFLYRLIRHFLYHSFFYTYFHPAVPREIILPEFRHQFGLEFGIHFSEYNEPPYLNLTAEWPMVEDLLTRYEASYPDLVSRLMRKLALAR